MEELQGRVVSVINEEGVEELECKCLSGFKADPDSLSKCTAKTTGAPTQRPTAFPTKRDMDLVDGVLASTEAPSIAPTALPTLHPTVAVCADGSHGCDQKTTECISLLVPQEVAGEITSSVIITCACLDGFETDLQNASQCVPPGVGWTFPDDGRYDFQ